MNDTVTVIVTCHNLEQYIGDAVRSVLGQDFQETFEIIVVDDWSTDASADIINEFEHVRYLRTPENLGVLMATVFGINSSSGDLLFFLDGDDIWEPSKLSKMVRRFRGDDRLALLTHDLSYIDSAGTDLDRSSRPEVRMAGVPVDAESAIIRDEILMHGDSVWLGSAFAVRRSLGRVNDFCDYARALSDPFNTYQDWPLAFWVASQPDVSLGYIGEKLFRYRLHGANYSGDSSSIEKALRNTTRTLNTTTAMLAIARESCISPRAVAITLAKVEFSRFQVEILRGARWPATVAFIRGLPFASRSARFLLKESVRFLGIQFVGPSRFTKFKRAFHGFRQRVG